METTPVIKKHRIISVSMPVKLVDKIDALAEKNKKSRSQLLQRAVKQYLDFGLAANKKVSSQPDMQRAYIDKLIGQYITKHQK